MKEIMAQASRGRTSTLSMSLSAEKEKADAAVKATAKTTTPKMSQKERKKQQQQQQQQQQQHALQQAVPQTSSKEQPPSNPRPLTPWQVPRAGPTVSLKDVFGAETSIQPPARATNPTISPVTLSQKPRRTASPDTRFSGQQRSNSDLQGGVAGTTSPNSNSIRASPQPPVFKAVYLNPQSHSYTSSASKAGPSLQLSMADIIGQQKREQDIIREAVAKRSLQEIQEEQAFQEWWDQESRRAQEEEAMRAAASTVVNGGNGGTRGKAGRRSRGGAQKGEGQGGKGDSSHSRGRGRGRGNGFGQGRSHGATAG